MAIKVRLFSATGYHRMYDNVTEPTFLGDNRLAFKLPNGTQIETTLPYTIEQDAETKD